MIYRGLVRPSGVVPLSTRLDTLGNNFGPDGVFFVCLGDGDGKGEAMPEAESDLR